MALNALAFIFFFLPKSIFNYFWGKEKNRMNITYYSTLADLSQERATQQVHTIHHPDIQLKGRNITLARAQQLDDTITDLTTDNAADLVGRVGVRVRVRAECEPAFTKLLNAAGVTTQRKDTINVPKITTGTSSSTPSGGGTTPAGGDDPNSGND